MSQSVFSLPQRVAVDANFLVALLSNKTSAEQRMQIDFFIQQLDKQKCTLVVPMPALAEYLVKADNAGVESINKFEREKYVLLADFNRAAAFEISLLDGAMVNANTKKDGVDQPWQRIKIDRQIVAIAKANSAQMIISQDSGVRAAALRFGMQCMSIEELPFPPGSAQTVLEFPESAPVPPLQ